MKLKYGEAIREALDDALKNDDSTVLFGQDIQYNVYGYTGDLLNKYGAERVINVPLSEAAVVGTAIGASMCGLKLIVDLTVANFLYVAMDQLASIAAKNAYMYNGQFKTPITIMYSTFLNTSSAAQHSDRPHPMLMNIPGLKVLAPAGPQDAYSLLRSAIDDTNPVLYYTDRSLFYDEEEVDTEQVVPIGQASLLVHGDDVTIVTISGAKKLVLNILPELKKNGISAELIDVRSLVPLNIDAIKKSVIKTGRIVIVDTANRTCSAAGEISSRLAEDIFAHLKAPIGIVAHDDIPVPFANNLEHQIMPTREKVWGKIISVLKF